ncbi:PREDICTED: uncharacterized protein LOC108567549 [Nicrophorus vespilloides]|uniref:Uncharacterized protein LOC108567549 n=1 Tax=Nicrophorus vespilloides TaxID=110193 RepID=A0ABM1N9S7_NICVS|nr:PREDICTED: uncharacterized protein LOC108567549 [Nicrophorus vespilloides]
MLDGWYCRSLANEQAAAEEQERVLEESKLKKQYKFLKGKLKHLLYENECFQTALRSSQKRLLMVTRDRSFLLDRLVLYEKPDNSSSESEDTESSDDENVKVEPTKKRRVDFTNSHNHVQSSGKSMPQVKKKRPPPKPKAHFSHNILHNINTTTSNNVILSDGHMTPEEVERHLQSRQSFLELERAPLTVPTEMFSNEPSLDSESNDIGELETSPSNMGEELSIDMINE